MVESRKPIPIAEAVQRVMEYKLSGSLETVPLSACYDRHLAKDLLATHDVPPFDRSPYDGFAVRASDTEKASPKQPLTLKVIEEIGAGIVAEKAVKSGGAIRIMTGAAIPEGADAVIMLEHVKEFTNDGNQGIEIEQPLKKGDNLSFQGEDTEKGKALVERGTKINPGVKALLATFGYVNVPVAKQPMIGVFTTGTELLDVHEALVPGKIRNSNSHMIESQIERIGGIPKSFGKLEDDFDACFTAVKQALDQVDILITTGGVSVGDYDYLPAIYEKLGANVLFNKVAMRPGSVTTVAVWENKLLFGLSGNPSACYVGFELFVRPVIKHLLFSKQLYLHKEQAELEADYPKSNPFTRLVRGKVITRDGQLFVSPTGLDKSGAVTSLADANALIVIPGGTKGYQAGETVDVLLLEAEGGREKWD